MVRARALRVHLFDGSADRERHRTPPPLVRRTATGGSGASARGRHSAPPGQTAGSFPNRMWLKTPAPGGPNTALALYEEEKRSDVNLATYLLVDGFRGLERNLPVWVLNPQQGQGGDLHTVATQHRTLRVGPLRASQFPANMTDAVGPFNKPPTWV